MLNFRYSVPVSHHLLKFWIEFVLLVEGGVEEFYLLVVALKLPI